MINCSPLAYNKTMPPSFKGRGGQNYAKKVMGLSQIFAPKTFKVEIFNKTKNENELCFLNIKNRPAFWEPVRLTIRDIMGKTIGRVNINKKEAIKTFEPSYMRVELLRNNKRDKYSGVGTTLIKAIVEISKTQASNGRLFLLAANVFDEGADPFLFYRKLGFTTIKEGFNPPQINKYIDNCSNNFLISKENLIKLIEKFGRNSFQKMNSDQKLENLYHSMDTIKNSLDLSKNLMMDLPENRLAMNLKIKELLEKTNLQAPQRTTTNFKFADYMFLHDKAIKEIWVPQISKSPIF